MFAINNEISARLRTHFASAPTNVVENAGYLKIVSNLNRINPLFSVLAFFKTVFISSS